MPNENTNATIRGSGSTDLLGPLPWGADIEAWLEVRDAAQIEADIRAYAAQEMAAERAESARLRHLLNLARDDYNTAAQRLQEIGDYAHDHSTGPAVPDALWEVRSMAYGA